MIGVGGNAPGRRHDVVPGVIAGDRRGQPIGSVVQVVFEEEGEVAPAAFGRRRERFTEAEGQAHLFELDSPLADESEDATAAADESEIDVSSHRRRSKKRQIDWDQLRQIRHAEDRIVHDPGL